MSTTRAAPLQIPNSMRLGSTPPDVSSSSSSSDSGRRIVRQSVCYDVKMVVEHDEDLEIVSRKICKQSLSLSWLHIL